MGLALERGFMKIRPKRFACDVIRDGFGLLDDQACLRNLNLNKARKKIQAGLDQFDRGEGIPGDQVYAKMKQKCAEFRKARR